MLFASFPYGHTGRNIVCSRIDEHIINVALAEFHRVHSASDIHAYDVRNGLVSNGHGGTDRASLTGVHVRHDPDPGSFSHGIIAHSPDLFDRFFFNDLCITDRCIYFSFDLYIFHFFLPHIRQRLLVRPTDQKPLAFKTICFRIRRRSSHIFRKRVRSS